MTWSDLVANRAGVLFPLYDELPPLTGVRLRSVNLDGWAPTVTLRLDLPQLAVESGHLAEGFAVVAVGQPLRRPPRCPRGHPAEHEPRGNIVW
ncbi:hypothetical protein [Streptomyces sp. NPDC086023]|uniref:hypothetical protein n=1 Tax=Streptomyces sp. NPDC086023 TaxID=3365746 RepID=UPI0037D09F95